MYAAGPGYGLRLDGLSEGTAETILFLVRSISLAQRFGRREQLWEDRDTPGRSAALT
jgi:hypothetical protein